jgi:GNAT superfamily N-acetyltransferase
MTAEDMTSMWRRVIERAPAKAHAVAELDGTGIGQALLEALERPEVLWVAADNPRAQAFYRRNHFAADGATQTEEFFGEPIDEIRMVRT